MKSETTKKAGNWFLDIAIFTLALLSFFWKFWMHFFGILIVPVIWFLRHRIKYLVDKLGIKGFTGFLVLGWLAIMSEETAYWLGGFRIFPDISLVGDFIATTPAAILVLLSWWWLNSRYQYSISEKFVLGGVLGFLTESLKVFSAYPPWVWILIVLQFFIIYGWMIMFPFWLLQDKIPQGTKKGRVKYVLGVLLPWFGILLTTGLWFPIIGPIVGG